MDKMLQTQGHRMIWGRPRAKTLVLIALAMITAYFVLFSEPGSQLQVVPYLHDKPADKATTGAEKPVSDEADDDSDDFTIDEEFKIPEKTKHKKPEWELTADEIKDWSDPDDREDPTNVEKGYETDGKYRSTGDLSKLQREKDMRKEWRHAYKVTANLPQSNLIYGNTLSNLEHKEDRSEEHRAYLRDDPNAAVNFSVEKPVRFNPYPDYNSDAWKEKGFAPYVPCKGATGEIVEDLLVFKGRPHDWPAPRLGSYDVLNMDANLCFERETRLGPYGTLDQFKKTGGESEPVSWDNVNWGDLQRKCVHKNAKRFDMNKSRKNDYLSLYPETAEPATGDDKPSSSEASKDQDEKSTDEKLQDSKTNDNEEAKEEKKDKRAEGPSLRRHALEDDEFQSVQNRSASGFTSEKRTAILLRSYTGKNYTDNDKQNIRSLVSELSLKSGGEYEVFLLVQVKDTSLRIFDDPETYQYVLSENIPPEFQGITVLWNDEVVWNIYTEMKDENERTVHTAQWLSVQKFSHDHPQFDFIWNWEMDFRFTGHHYELLNKLEGFSKKQPRKGLWERNERWYVPEYHGDYDTAFRKDIERRYGNDTVWGPPDLPFINPAGPKPPVSSPFLDDYEWGVGEDADVITVGPLFNPINSNWVIANHVWGYKDEDHKSKDLPRRTTIVTQSRLSKRLLDMMHVENMRGNHVASEMTPQTVALLHGFKAVYAPHPIFMDRDWDGKFLNKWFNPGENGECGGRGSPMGWGRERRYQGTTWYYRAEPPNRLYNNWMGWPDTGIGGKSWEEKHGRPCLPQVMLHQVKDSVPTSDDHATGFELAYG